MLDIPICFVAYDSAIIDLLQTAIYDVNWYCSNRWNRCTVKLLLSKHDQDQRKSLSTYALSVYTVVSQKRRIVDFPNKSFLLW